jgi:hypothetical protein
MTRWHDWVQRRTLKQYALLVAVVSLVVATVIDAVTAGITEPFSWIGVIVWSAVMTAAFTWWRKGSLADGNEYPAGQGDDPTSS